MFQDIVELFLDDAIDIELEIRFDLATFLRSLVFKSGFQG